MFTGTVGAIGKHEAIPIALTLSGIGMVAVGSHLIFDGLSDFELSAEDLAEIEAYSLCLEEEYKAKFKELDRQFDEFDKRIEQYIIESPPSPYDVEWDDETGTFIFPHR